VIPGSGGKNGGGNGGNDGGGGAAGSGNGGNGGATPAVLWRSTFEPMNLSEWTSDGDGGYAGDAATMVAVVGDVVHRGRYAAKLTISPKPSAVPALISAQYLYRQTPSPTEAYYSAWFYFPSNFTIPVGMNYISLFHFVVSASGDGKNPSPLWDLNFITVSGALVPQIYNFNLVQNTRQNNGLAAWTAPRDTWFHVEVLFAKASTPTGRIAVWLDDSLVIDLNKVVTVPNDWLQWNAGAASDDIEPAPASIYMDDAAISTSRLGSQPPP